VAEDGGKNPAWKEEDPQNKAEFRYLPGVEYLRVEVWNSNVMSTTNNTRKPEYHYSSYLPPE
jgi:hypothetical protein